MKAHFYSNVNGVENEYTRELPDTFDFMDAVHDAFYGSGSLFNDALSLCPPSSNAGVTPKNFPKSSVYVDAQDKTYNILVDAMNVGDDEYRVEVDGNKIVVTFDHKLTEQDKRRKLYSHKFRTITNEVIPFEFDPTTHDINTAVVKLEKGCLSIVIQPREELKPVKRVLGGGLTRASSDKAEEKDTTSRE